MGLGKSVIRLIWLGDNHNNGSLPAGRMGMKRDTGIEDMGDDILTDHPGPLGEEPIHARVTRSRVIGGGLEECLKLHSHEGLERALSNRWGVIDHVRA